MAKKKKEVVDTMEQQEPVVEISTEEIPTEASKEESVVADTPKEEFATVEKTAVVETPKEEPVKETSTVQTPKEEPSVKETAKDAPAEIVLQVEHRATLGKVSSEDFKPGIHGWYTSANDTKKRYNPGVFSNNQLGKFGTLRVFENGTVEFVTHTDFAKRKKRFTETEERFEVKLVSEDRGILETKTVVVKV